MILVCGAAAARAGVAAVELAQLVADDVVGIGQGYFIVAGSLAGSVGAVTGIVLLWRRRRSTSGELTRKKSH